MHDEIATKASAACLGLGGFIVALIAGLAVDNSAETVLIRALLAMPLCAAIGYFAGHIGTSTINRSIMASAESAKQDATAAAQRARALEMASQNQAAADADAASRTPGRVAA